MEHSFVTHLKVEFAVHESMTTVFQKRSLLEPSYQHIGIQDTKIFHLPNFVRTASHKNNTKLPHTNHIYK